MAVFKMMRLLVCVTILAAVQGAPFEKDGMEVVDVGGGGIRAERGGMRGDMEREKEEQQPELRSMKAQSEPPKVEPESPRIDPEPLDGLKQREFPRKDLSNSEVAQDMPMLIFAIFGDDSYLDKDGELAPGSRLMLEKDGEHVPDSGVILEKDRPLALSSIMKSPALAPRTPLLNVEGREVFMRFANDD